MLWGMSTTAADLDGAIARVSEYLAAQPAGVIALNEDQYWVGGRPTGKMLELRAEDVATLLDHARR